MLHPLTAAQTLRLQFKEQLINEIASWRPLVSIQKNMSEPVISHVRFSMEAKLNKKKNSYIWIDKDFAAIIAFYKCILAFKLHSRGRSL